MKIFISIIVGIHIFISIALVGVILLHSGKGTGLSESFGGALPSSMSGTSIIEKNLNRITITLSILFAITSVILYLFYVG